VTVLRPRYDQHTVWPMKALARFALLALLTVTLPAACGNDDDDENEQSGTGGASGSDEEGLQMCCTLGALCHRVGDQNDAAMDECHDIGHENDPAECRANYERCLDLCGAAGAGGASAPHACL
jgi:hypothetical protein